MEITEFLNYRDELLDQARDEDGFIQESLLISEILPYLVDAKLIDSEDFNNCYFKSTTEKLKVNGYLVNESGERLQIFILDESTIDLTATSSDLQVSLKSAYETQFKRASKFLEKALKRHLDSEVQDSSPARALISQISSNEGREQFDVIEIFLISTTATISLMGNKPQPKRIDFDSEDINITFTRNREKVVKNLLIKKRLIDLNFLYDVLISQGNREPLSIDFTNLFGAPIEAIKAADEDHFESFLCVLPASVLSKLYKEYSTRLLEKNVRSFLQFRGVNKGIRDTIRKEPEKFIAYNNGLTITASKGDVTCNQGKVLLNSLKDFQIVNGGQTTATIYFTQKDGFDISKVNVMAKINIAKEATDEELEELISNISTYSNAQSRVSKVDLRSRNPQLVKLKSLSESVVTPSGQKWFFERAKGEFNTKMRIAGSNKNRLKKEYPNERRFSKEQLAKYYSAWEEHPYMVKKGGEKIFRFFIEELCGEGKSKRPINIDRTFYEELIAKVILFRNLEKIYGQGKNSMGQIRSAVIPYSLSVLYKYTDGSKSGRKFNLSKIWQQEGLENDLEGFIKTLLELMNDLIKKYSLSDDLGEYSKKPELWASIIKSPEIENFMTTKSSVTILNRYTVSSKDLKDKVSKTNVGQEVNFEPLHDNILIHTNGVLFYKKIMSSLNGEVSPAEERLVSSLLHSIINKKDLDQEHLEKEKAFLNKVRINNPELFDRLEIEHDFLLYDTLNFVIREYNKAIETGENVISRFNKLSTLFAAKGKQYSSSFSEIGKNLKDGKPPLIKEIYYASNSLSSSKAVNKNLEKLPSLSFSESELRKMVEWDSKLKILTENERSYLADFAYGLKKLNSFHKKNIERHLMTLLKSGYKQ